MAYGYYLEAEYESGYIHSEDEQDHSPFMRHKNIFNDILEKRPEKAHGKLVRFSLVGPKHTYSVPFADLPDNARPIYFRDMEMKTNIGTDENTVSMTKQTFGYQFNDEEGHNHREVQEIE